jgi:L-fuculose-phosphate aldolase
MSEPTPIVQSGAEPGLQTLQSDLLHGFHILDQAGQGTGIAGHLTARLPGASTFWGHRWRLGFDEVGKDDLVESDFELRTVSGSGTCNPTLHIHTQIYRARPDIKCIAHTHAANVVALSVTGSQLMPVTQTGCFYFDDVCLLDEFDGIVLDTEEGDTIARSLGDNHAILLKHHGLITVGDTISDAVIGATVLDYACEVQLKAMAAGHFDTLPDEAARQSQGFVRSSETLKLRWAHLKRKARRARPDIFREVDRT